MKLFGSDKQTQERAEFARDQQEKAKKIVADSLDEHDHEVEKVARTLFRPRGQ